MAIARPVEITRKRMTEDEFMRLPDNGRKYELVDGEAKEVPANFEHDVIGGNVVFALKSCAKGVGFVAISQAGFRMTTSNLRCPDVSFTHKSRLVGGKPGKGFGDAAPDLCIEIISPSEDAADSRRKLREYFASGAKYVWHMHPEPQTIKVFTSPTEFRIYNSDEHIDCVDLIPDFRASVADLFALE